jgi:ketosteroid isomerase-like protein
MLHRRSRLLALAAVPLAGAAACARGDASPAADAALADTLSRRIAAAYDFSRPDVVERLMDLYPAEGPLVSAAAGRVTTSRDALRAEIERFWERVGQNMRQPRFVMERPQLARLGDDAAVLTFAYSIPHHTPEGRPHTLAGAWTAVFARRGGRWVIVQEHLSDVPSQPAAPAATDSAAAPHAHSR